MIHTLFKSWSSFMGAYPVLPSKRFKESLSVMLIRFFSSPQNEGKTEVEPEISLYPGHVSTSYLQKFALTVGSGLMSISDPSRDDMISTFGETTGHLALRWMRSKMLDDPIGRRILQERPRIRTSTIDFDHLATLPRETFGGAYHDFLVTRGFSPDARMEVRFVDDADLAYVMTRYRECHDLFHVLLGAHTNMLGEISVKWVEGIQLGLPMCLLGAFAGPVRLGPIHRDRYFSVFLPWALEQGVKAKFIMNIYYEEHWEDDLERLRKNMNIEPAPQIKSSHQLHVTNFL